MFISLDFEEVQWELQVWGGVFPGRGITSGFSQIAKIPKPDDVKCWVTHSANFTEAGKELCALLQSGSLLQHGECF